MMAVCSDVVGLALVSPFKGTIVIKKICLVTRYGKNEWWLPLVTKKPFDSSRKRCPYHLLPVTTPKSLEDRMHFLPKGACWSRWCVLEKKLIVPQVLVAKLEYPCNLDLCLNEYQSRNGNCVIASVSLPCLVCYAWMCMSIGLGVSLDPCLVFMILRGI